MKVRLSTSQFRSQATQRSQRESSGSFLRNLRSAGLGEFLEWRYNAPAHANAARGNRLKPCESTPAVYLTKNAEKLTADRRIRLKWQTSELLLQPFSPLNDRICPGFCNEWTLHVAQILSSPSLH
jgi:hypothetical protein